MGLPHPFACFWRRVGTPQRQRGARLLPFRRSPLRFDLNSSIAADGPLAKAAPFPIIRPNSEPALHRIAMKISQLLNSLLFTPHRKIVVANLPKASEICRPESARGNLFEHLNRHREIAALWLGHQQMHMLRHDNVPRNKAAVPAPNSFELLLKDLSRFSSTEKLLPAIAAEGDEMKAPLVLVSLRLRHEGWRNCTPILSSASRTTRMGQSHNGASRSSNSPPAHSLNTAQNSR